MITCTMRFYWWLVSSYMCSDYRFSSSAMSQCSQNFSAKTSKVRQPLHVVVQVRARESNSLSLLPPSLFAPSLCSLSSLYLLTILAPYLCALPLRPLLAPCLSLLSLLPLPLFICHPSISHCRCPLISCRYWSGSPKPYRWHSLNPRSSVVRVVNQQPHSHGVSHGWSQWLGICK